MFLGLVLRLACLCLARLGLVLCLVLACPRLLLCCLVLLLLVCGCVPCAVRVFGDSWCSLVLRRWVRAAGVDGAKVDALLGSGPGFGSVWSVVSGGAASSRVGAVLSGLVSSLCLLVSCGSGSLCLASAGGGGVGVGFGGRVRGLGRLCWCWWRGGVWWWRFVWLVGVLV